MNRAELVTAIAQKVDLSKKDVDLVVAGFVDAVAGAVASGDKVTLVGFGTFEARHRQARTGRNPSTGETLQIAASTVPAFSAGKQFKDLVAKK